LNLDTSVAFLTPVLVYTARSRGGGEAPLLYGCLLLSNAGSLFLVGSNLTNLIVLGPLHLSGAAFFTRMWAPALAALVVTAAVVAVLGLPTLAGLFGVAVALGTLGRLWAGPAVLLSHLDLWGTAAAAAACSVLVNNLPAASLLAARPPAHPYALLVGLNLGPHLFATGSLAWVLWLRVARNAGAQPSVARATRIGAVAVPLSMAAAVALLALTGSS
jgi:Na+/H+ antiporter NhaD/arsenite permease-like protein